jgi:tetraacyldisaccharide 4'-kinase
VAVVSRGYKGQVTTWARVATDGDSRVFGDEPLMLAQKFPEVPIYVGADRVAVVRELLSREKVQLIFTDDTFQHRRLKRNLDVLILDCTEAPSHYEVVPLGRGREDKSGLNRSDFVILNKVNLASPEKKQELVSFVEELRGDREIPIIECEYYIHRFSRLDGQGAREASAYEKVALVSGVGRPQTFEDLMKKHFDVRKHFIFRDHHDYTESDVEKLIAQVDKLGVTRVITTEKDAVKLRRFSNLKEKIWVAELAPKLSLRVKSLYEKILSQVL